VLAPSDELLPVVRRSGDSNGIVSLTAWTGDALLRSGQPEAAESILRETLELAHESSHALARSDRVLRNCAPCLLELGRFSEAEELLLQAEEEAGDSPVEQRSSALRLADFYEAAGREEEAAELRARLW